ncbi:hypothetical protein THOG11_60084 [Vibrio harveyi]|nr:hypothetical protein TH15OA1_440032 [Vibrio harveyi]CAH1573798.1 hypothetical protein THOD03_50086 [Vibrio harveyi]CAH1583006.1 hypothetical protein THOG11_60084 [Vibrio harveyi]CAK6711663.1 hypothetical protein HORM4_1030033 [Vibrio harveyi]
MKLVTLKNRILTKWQLKGWLKSLLINKFIEFTTDRNEFLHS